MRKLSDGSFVGLIFLLGDFILIEASYNTLVI